MTINTQELREEIKCMEKQADYHRAQSSKAYEERDPMASSFQSACAKLCDKHARNMRAIMVLYDFVEHIG